MESKSLKIDFNGVNFHCYFFLPDQIEFDIDPREIKTVTDFESIEKFMISISKTLKNQVTLTGENSPEFPLFKIEAQLVTCSVSSGSISFTHSCSVAIV